MKILIAYDGSEYADFALEDLKSAGLPDMAEALVLTIGEAWELPIVIDRVSASSARFVPPTTSLIEEHLAEVTQKARTIASAASKRIQQIFPQWKITIHASIGKPAADIINKADKWSPDLIVVGSQGRSAIGRFFLGSVSQKVLNESLCSVRISKKRESGEHSGLRILLAVDGSEHSEKTVREVAGRNWKAGAEFRLITVNDPFVHNEFGFVAWDFDKDQPSEGRKSDQWIEKIVKTPARILRSAGLQVSEAIRWGDAGNMILQEARVWEADTIFLGARGLSPFKRFLLGSISSFVTLRAECSVEVIK